MKLSKFIGALYNIPSTMRVTRIQHIFHTLDVTTLYYFNYTFMYKTINTYISKKHVEVKRKKRLDEEKNQTSLY